MMDVSGHVWKKESARPEEKATAEGGSVRYGTNRGGLSKDRLKTEKRQIAPRSAHRWVDDNETPESIAISERARNSLIRPGTPYGINFSWTGTDVSRWPPRNATICL